jgi:hypothetical protein
MTATVIETACKNACERVCPLSKGLWLQDIDLSAGKRNQPGWRSEPQPVSLPSIAGFTVLVHPPKLSFDEK